MNAPANGPPVHWAPATVVAHNADNADQLQQVVIVGVQANELASRQGVQLSGDERRGELPVEGASVTSSQAPVVVDVQAVQAPVQEVAPTSAWSRYLRRFLRALGFLGPSRVQVRYPTQFKALAMSVLGVAISWVGNYLFVVLPSIEDNRARLCTYNQYNDSQLTYNAKMLFVYFLWFAVARTSLFIPCVAARVAVIQSRTHGFCRTYCVHLVIRDGPLYIFVVGSMLFWFHLMQSPHCEERNPDLYQTLKLYAIYSCMVSVVCLLLAYWHNKLLVEAARAAFEPEDHSAPPDTISKLETRAYDESLFGDEEGKLYPSECAICLGTWEPDDVIKVTQCQHAFHEECIGHWLQTARTCALCRQDLTKAPLPTARSMPGARLFLRPEPTPVADTGQSPTNAEQPAAGEEQPAEVAEDPAELPPADAEQAGAESPAPQRQSSRRGQVESTSI